MKTYSWFHDFCSADIYSSEPDSRFIETHGKIETILFYYSETEFRAMIRNKRLLILEEKTFYTEEEAKDWIENHPLIKEAQKND